MSLKNLLLLFSIGLFTSGCATITDTSSLFTRTASQNDSLTYLLEEDGHYQLADLLIEKEDKLAHACSANNNIVMDQLEHPDRGKAFLKWITGKANIIPCQNAIRDVAYTIDRIIEMYPKYKDFKIVIPGDEDDDF